MGIVVMACAGLPQSGHGAAFWVGPNGNDAGPGDEARPFATLERARDAVRALRTARPAAQKEGITVWLRGGFYEREATFELDERDSGSADAPVVYRAVDGERPRLSGGRRIPGNAFRPVVDEAVVQRLDVTVRDRIRVCDLRELGITEFGELSRATFNGGPMLELFVNGKALPISRWPNGREWATYGKVIDAGSRPRWQEKPERPGTLEYNGDRPKRWQNATDVWLHGYWAFDWYDDVLKVAKLDTEARRITFTTPHTYGLKSKRRYAALNLIEEIEQPGEWVLERASGKLFLYPPASLDDAEIVVSMVGGPLLRMRKTQHVVVQGLTFEYGRGNAVEMLGGVRNLLAGCTIRNMGTSAVSIRPADVKSDGHLRVETGDRLVDGRENGVQSCDIYNVGTSGISLSGGDRRTLTPAGHFAINNDIHHYSRRKRTNCPAIGLAGVGQHAAHNTVHDAPHCGINYGGNDHVIELNELSRLCWETGDVGAIYTGRNWTFRGNVVRHNFIHHTIAPGQVGSMGVYLDDSHSSTTIAGNVFYQCDYAAFIGGGRDNVVENNIFVDCRKSVHLDNRSQGWAHKYQVRGGDHRMFGKLEEVRHDQPPYSERFPALARILEENPHEPRGNRVVSNLCVRGNWLHVFKGAEKILTLENNVVTREDPGFEAPDVLNFSLPANAPISEELQGFSPIPFGNIGLRLDDYRRRMPVKAPRIVPDGRAFAEKLAVELRTEREDVEIRYTIDGSEPVAQSPRYNGPVILTRSTTIKAMALDGNDPAAPPSPVAEATFALVEFGAGKGVFLSDLAPESASVHGGLKKDTNYRKNDFITMSGTVFEKGVLLHPKALGTGGSQAQATYALEAPLDNAKAFLATIGVDDGADHRGSVSFKVDLLRGDEWQTAFESPVLRGRPREEQMEVAVELDGATKLRLVTDGGDDVSCDHAAWGNARLE
mgnify:FL=1|jgi:parallel beta-helix repeat protein